MSCSVFSIENAIEIPTKTSTFYQHQIKICDVGKLKITVIVNGCLMIVNYIDVIILMKTQMEQLYHVRLQRGIKRSRCHLQVDETTFRSASNRPASRDNHRRATLETLPPEVEEYDGYTMVEAVEKW